MNALLAIAELLNEQECHSYTLHATDSGFWTARAPQGAQPGVRAGRAERDGRASLSLTIIGRTQFEGICLAIGVTPKERVMHVGQRSWWAESDTSTRRLLIEGVSFQHHDDWESRT